MRLFGPGLRPRFNSSLLLSRHAIARPSPQILARLRSASSDGQKPAGSQLAQIPHDIRPERCRAVAAWRQGPGWHRVLTATGGEHVHGRMRGGRTRVLGGQRRDSATMQRIFAPRVGLCPAPSYPSSRVFSAKRDSSVRPSLARGLRSTTLIAS